MPHRIDTAIDRMPVTLEDSRVDLILGVSKTFQLPHRDGSVLPIREGREFPVPTRPRVWLSFVVHHTTKLNHTLVSPPFPASVHPCCGFSGIKKAAGPRTGGFSMRLVL
jgi:hypothetical protein